MNVNNSSPSTRFRREGLPRVDADWVRLIHGALRSRSGAEAVELLVTNEASNLPPLARLRGLGLLPELAMTSILDADLLEQARQEALVAHRDVPRTALVNAIWAWAALYVLSAGQMISTAARHARTSAEITGLDEALLTQEMLVTAGLGQLRDGHLEKAQDLLDHLCAEHADTPARWMMLACRVADFEVLSGVEPRSRYLTGLPETVRPMLSHDDSVDLAEASYLYAFGSGVRELSSVTLAEQDAFGLRVPHVTPLRRRASYRAYRIIRLRTALGARPLPWMTTTANEALTPDAAYARAVVATATFDGLLWAGYTSSIDRLRQTCAPVVDFLQHLNEPGYDGSVEVSAGAELINRLFGFAQRFEDAPRAIAAVGGALMSWITTQDGRGAAITVEATHITAAYRTNLSHETRADLDQLFASPPKTYAKTTSGEVAVLEALDAVEDRGRCWRRLLATSGRR